MASRFLSPFGGRSLAGRGDPFLDLHREMNRLFDDAFRGMGQGRGGSVEAPRLDVHEAGENFEITAELPGVKPEEVELRLEGDVLTISGEKRQEHEDKQARLVERSYGAFSRSLQLPFQPDPGKVRADFEHGVLKITVPRENSEQQSRRIPIGGASERGAAGGATEQKKGGGSKLGASQGAGGQGASASPGAVP
jgi:HSP20 family protein